LNSKESIREYRREPNKKTETENAPAIPSLAAKKTAISETVLDQLFRQARTHSAWQQKPVRAEVLREAFELARLGPTSANGSSARFVFLTTTEARLVLSQHKEV
jgi:hypothetical protein